MKSILTIFLCITALCANGQSFAERSSAGIKADVNASFFIINENTNVKSSVKAGGSTGFFYKCALWEIAVIEADILFSYHATGIKNLTTGETANYNFLVIDLPLYFMRQVEIENRLLYFGIGPFVSFGMFGNYKSDTRSVNPYKKHQANGRASINRWDWGVSFIIGYELECKLQFNLNHQLGFRNLFDESFEKIDMVSHLFSLGVGYRF